jgi:hypothetical protein
MWVFQGVAIFFESWSKLPVRPDGGLSGLALRSRLGSESLGVVSSV